MEKISADKKTLRKFGLVVGGMFGLLFGLIFPWISGKAIPTWPFYLLGGFWILAIVFSTALLPIHWFWMKLGHYLGWINTRIILGILFFLIFTPLAWLLALLGKKPIRAKVRNKEDYRVFPDAKNRMNMEVPY